MPPCLTGLIELRRAVEESDIRGNRQEAFSGIKKDSTNKEIQRDKSAVDNACGAGGEHVVADY